MSDAPTMGDFLGADAPGNRGKRGPDDELGCLIDAGEVLRGARQIKSGAPVNPIAIR